MTTMKQGVRFRGLWLVGLGAGFAWGQGLPPAVPTNAPAASTTAPAAASVKPSSPRRPKVTWVGGLLTIAADDSSLNSILREVSRQTGMKVTGGVADERVYGNYGPGAPEAVLGTLLTGTGSNMLLKENTADRPMELVLTSRQGGATPPGPGTLTNRDDERQDDLPPQRIVPSSRAAIEPARNPPASGQESVTGGGGANPAAAASPTTVTTTDQQSPNGVKTPQEIYDQLMKLQQQKAAAQPGVPPR